MSLESVFVRDGERYLATDLALGPWVRGALHGGAPAALLAHAFARAAPSPTLRPARITYEFVRPVPVGPLSVSVQVVRPGRRVTLLDAVLTDPEGTEVTRARALLLTASELDVTPRTPPPFRGQPGPATAWFRLRQPLIADESIAPLERVAAAADFGNGIASVLSWEEHTFINPDLTLYVEREPIGEWVALQSQMRVSAGSVAMAESVLWDQEGRIGHATQALLVARTT
jgi:acyl-coenzyme A thioesterase PaaI-like protein